jgi:hypothetical protein
MHSGAASGCGAGQELHDADGDGWGECVPLTAALDARTIVWWHTSGSPPQELCDLGFETASASSFVPGGLDRTSYVYLCATLGLSEPPLSNSDPTAAPEVSTP